AMRGGSAASAAVTLATAATAVTLAPAPAAAAITAAATAGRSGIPSAHAGQLLGRLALDVGIVGEPQPDPATLLFHLDGGDVALVALIQDVLDRADPLARLHVRDVKQAVRALGQLDERPEVGRLHDLALEAIADLDVLRHRGDPLGEGVDQLAGGRVEPHSAV